MPIVVGYSFGGLIAQELLANNLVAAAVAIDPAPIKGVKVLPAVRGPLLLTSGTEDHTVPMSVAVAVSTAASLSGSAPHEA
jgi:dienelactone hydrolase